MKMIVAVSPDNRIGDIDGNLLYHDSEDMALFKKWTKDNAVIVGRKTADTFKDGVLKGRYNLVFSKRMDRVLTLPAVVLPNKDERIYVNLVSIDSYIDLMLKNNISVSLIGGGEAYRSFCSCCDVAFVNRFYEMPKIDDSRCYIWFENHNLTKFTLVNLIQHENFQTEVYVNYERLNECVERILGNIKSSILFRLTEWEDKGCLALLHEIRSGAEEFDCPMLNKMISKIDDLDIPESTV